VSNIVVYDVNNVQIGKGAKNLFGDTVFQMNDGKTVKFKISGSTGDLREKMILLSAVLRELSRAGYYPF
jgi:hypothetical protein